MKKILMTVACMISVTAIFAQEQAESKRGPYLTNRFFDNWFLGVGAGVTTLNVPHLDAFDKTNFALDITLGKWLTPCTGVRLQYNGMKLNETYKKMNGDNRVDYFNLHGDFMYQLSNALGGYRADRFWNFVPFVGFGMAKVCSDYTKANEQSYYYSKRHSISANVGLLNNVRLCSAVDLTLEVKYSALEAVSRKWYGIYTFTGGLSYKFNHREFSRPEKPVVADYTPYKNRIQTLEDQLADVNAKNKQLASENATLRNRPAAQNTTETVAAPMAVFFTIGDAQLSEKELINLGYLAKIIKESPEKTFKLYGYADKQTGSVRRNQQLSRERAQNVYDALVSKFGVDKKQLEIVANGSDGARFDEAALNRVVIAE